MHTSQHLSRGWRPQVFHDFSWRKPWYLLVLLAVAAAAGGGMDWSFLAGAG